MERLTTAQARTVLTARVMQCKPITVDGRLNRLNFIINWYNIVLNFAISIFACPIFRGLNFTIFSKTRKSQSLILAKFSEKKALKIVTLPLWGEQVSVKGDIPPPGIDRSEVARQHDKFVCVIASEYNGTPLYGHPLNTDSPILRTAFFVPTKSLYISLKKITRLLRTPVNTDNGHSSVSRATNSYRSSTRFTDTGYRHWYWLVAVTDKPGSH